MNDPARASGVSAPDRPRRQQAPIYVIRLRGHPGSDAHGVRAILKIAWRRFGLRCIGISEESATDESKKTQDTDKVS
jgi:hypothetical protein